MTLRYSHAHNYRLRHPLCLSMSTYPRTVSSQVSLGAGAAAAANKRKLPPMLGDRTSGSRFNGGGAPTPLSPRSLASRQVCACAFFHCVSVSRARSNFMHSPILSPPSLSLSPSLPFHAGVRVPLSLHLPPTTLFLFSTAVLLSSMRSTPQSANVLLSLSLPPLFFLLPSLSTSSCLNGLCAQQMSPPSSGGKAGHDISQSHWV